jgi:hypothetical protein
MSGIVFRIVSLAAALAAVAAIAGSAAAAPAQFTRVDAPLMSWQGSFTVTNIIRDVLAGTCSGTDERIVTETYRIDEQSGTPFGDGSGVKLNVKLVRVRADHGGSVNVACKSGTSNWQFGLTVDPEQSSAGQDGIGITYFPREKKIALRGAGVLRSAGYTLLVHYTIDGCATCTNDFRLPGVFSGNGLPTLIDMTAAGGEFAKDYRLPVAVDGEKLTLNGTFHNTAVAPGGVNNGVPWFGWSRPNNTAVAQGGIEQLHVIQDLTIDLHGIARDVEPARCGIATATWKARHTGTSSDRDWLFHAETDVDYCADGTRVTKAVTRANSAVVADPAYVTLLRALKEVSPLSFEYKLDRKRVVPAVHNADGSVDLGVESDFSACATLGLPFVSGAAKPLFKKFTGRAWKALPKKARRALVRKAFDIAFAPRFAAIKLSNPRSVRALRDLEEELIEKLVEDLDPDVEVCGMKWQPVVKVRISPDGRTTRLPVPSNFWFEAHPFSN